jgi:hypothetical protein
MAEAALWEQRYIERFVHKSKRERYLHLLKGPKHRKKLLDRLNHAFEYDPRNATSLGGAERTSAGLTALLRRLYVADTCYLVADGNPNDGKELRLEAGVEVLLGNHWGAILICPPKPIGVYKAEDIGELVLLE